MSKPWNMAGVRHRQTPRKYKPCGPVGEKLSYFDHEQGPKRSWLSTGYGELDAIANKCCGYHACSCPPKAFALATKLELLEALKAEGMLDREAVIAFLTTGEVTP